MSDVIFRNIYPSITATVVKDSTEIGDIDTTVDPLLGFIKDTHKMVYLNEASTGSTSLTYDVTGRTITRVSGSFITDGFTAGSTITVIGTDSNDGTYTILYVVALVITLISTDTLVTETVSSTVNTKTPTFLKAVIQKELANTVPYYGNPFIEGGSKTIYFTTEPKGRFIEILLIEDVA